MVNKEEMIPQIERLLVDAGEEWNKMSTPRKWGCVGATGALLAAASTGALWLINKGIILKNLPLNNDPMVEEPSENAIGTASALPSPTSTLLPTETLSPTHTATITLTPSKTPTPSIIIPKKTGTAITEADGFPKAQETQLATRFIDTALEIPIEEISDDEDFINIVGATADVLNLYQAEGISGMLPKDNFFKNQLLTTVQNIWETITGEEHHNDIPQTSSHNTLFALFIHIEQLLKEDGHSALLDLATAFNNQDMLQNGFATVNSSFTIDVAYMADIDADRPQDTPDASFHPIYGPNASKFNIDIEKLQQSNQIIQGGIVSDTPKDGDATIGKQTEENGLCYRYILQSGKSIYISARNLNPLLWRDGTSQIITTTDNDGNIIIIPNTPVPAATPVPVDTPVIPSTPVGQLDMDSIMAHLFNKAGLAHLETTISKETLTIKNTSRQFKVDSLKPNKQVIRRNNRMVKNQEKHANFI